MGPCFAYVFACTWEDHCKIGFSADPLARMQALHQRWFEFFDLEASVLVQAEAVADARALELLLRRPLVAHRAPVPLTVRPQAGGHSEWLRGARPALLQAVADLAADGHIVHAPARPWLYSALAARSDRLYEWAPAQLQLDDAGSPAASPSVQRLVRDAADACVALGLRIEDLMPAPTLRWYRRTIEWTHVPAVAAASIHFSRPPRDPGRPAPRPQSRREWTCSKPATCS